MDAEQDSPPARKPPLGVCPPDIYEFHRAQELARAIHERLESGFRVKREWIIELLDRHDRWLMLEEKKTFQPTEF